MDAYRCAYRDPKSPLTPIPPMDTSTFDFNALINMKSLTPKTPQYQTIPVNTTHLSVTKINSKTAYAVATKTPQCQTIPVKTTHLSVSKINTNASYLAPTKTPQFQTIPVNTTHLSFSKRNSNTANVVATKTPTTQKKTIKCVTYEEVNGEVTIKRSYHESITTINTGGVPTKATKKITPRPLLLNPGTETCRCTYKTCSPVPPKPLCPKVARVLNEVGLGKYKSLFQEQEIDYDVFKMLTEEDLCQLGIRKQIERDVLLNAAHHWSDFY